jgi:hypothetical protein
MIIKLTHRRKYGKVSELIFIFIPEGDEKKITKI